MPMSKEFTGRHMLITMVSAFGVIVTVNLIMASFAIGTFPGTIVKNSYVASQDYNKQLAAAKDRVALQWQADMTFNGALLQLTVADKTGMSIQGLTLHGRAGRPASALEDQELALIETAPGTYTVPLTLPAGRWEIRLHGRDLADQLVVALSEDIWVQSP